LKEFSLYCNAEKFQLGVSKVGILAFVDTPRWIALEFDQISTFKDSFTWKSNRDDQVLLRFRNFYWRFIQKFAQVTLPLTETINNAYHGDEPRNWKPPLPHSESFGQVNWERTRKAELAFGKSRTTFREVPILQHVDATTQMMLQPDLNRFTKSGILK
jgi:hypothetical protein